MNTEFDIILDTYLKDNNNKVDSSSPYYMSLRNLELIFKDMLDTNKYKIQFSCGQGNKARVPWICIFNRNITTTAQYGIYIGYLFRKDMQGFYLTITQGITTFENKYKLSKYEYAKRVADYFKDCIKTDKFSKNTIELKEIKGSLGYGYEKTTIISKYYEKGNYTNQELVEDFNNIVTIYDNICDTIQSLGYDEIVKNVIDDIDSEVISEEEANILINEILEKQEKVNAKLVEKEIPKGKKKTSKKSTRNKVKKIDNIRKTIKDAKIGKKGEQKVLDYEIEKLEKMGRKDLIKDVKWVAKEDDTLGYDIVSYNIKEDGEKEKIYIEVKTTEAGENNRFFITQNELEAMQKHKNNYWIYRVYNLNKEQPEFYKMNYQEFKSKIELKCQIYIAEIKNESK